MDEVVRMRISVELGVRWLWIPHMSEQTVSTGRPEALVTSMSRLGQGDAQHMLASCSSAFEYSAVPDQLPDTG